MGFVRLKRWKLACEIFNEKLKNKIKSLFKIKYGIKNKKINIIKVRINNFIILRLLKKSDLRRINKLHRRHC